jgi:hypothetical protein
MLLCKNNEKKTCFVLKALKLRLSLLGHMLFLGMFGLWSSKTNWILLLLCERAVDAVTCSAVVHLWQCQLVNFCLLCLDSCVDVSELVLYDVANFVLIVFSIFIACFMVLHVTKRVTVSGVPEPYNVQARKNGESNLLAISKTAFHDLMLSYPEQNDIILTNLLQQYGLSRDGGDAVGAAAQGDESMQEMREELKVRIA